MHDMKTKKRLTYISLYLVFLVVLFEGSARLILSIPQLKARLQHQGDLSWRRAWIERHQNKGVEVYYAFDIYDPSKGWMSKPNIRNMTVFGNKTLNTNSKGFRGKNEYAYTKNPDKFRILIVGDSFTFGDEVSDNETYSYYLQSMIPNAEVMNFGVHGYGHDQMLILLEEQAANYSPDLIILGFLPTDMSRNLLRFRDYAKPRFVLKNNELKQTGTPVPTPQDILRWSWARPRIVDLISIIGYRIKKMSGLHEKEEKIVTTAILTKIVEMQSQSSCTCRSEMKSLLIQP